MFQYFIDIAIFVASLLMLAYVYALAWRFWVMAVQTEFNAKINWIMIEVRLPRVIDKSPQAFEIAAGAFLQTGGIANRFKVFWLGSMPIYHTLEIVSLEGEIHFYIRIQSKFKALVTNNIYSQYPTVEISEVEDYMTKFKMTHLTPTSKFNIWGINYGLSKDIKLGEEEVKPIALKMFDYLWKAIVYITYGIFVAIYDAIHNMFIEHEHGHTDEKAKKAEIKLEASYLPIKTYIDYAMDKDPKEIFKHDPLTPVLEWLGSLGKGQYGIYQICISDEGNFKSKGHGLAQGGSGKWPAWYENKITGDLINLKTAAKLRLDQLRIVPVSVKNKKGDQVYDNYGNPVNKMVESDEKDENGKAKMKQVPVTYGADVKVGGERIKENELNMEEKNEIELINRKISKPTFLATVRSAFIVLDGNGDGGASVQSTLSMLKQFGRADFEYGLGGGPATGGVYDYDWEDSFKKKKPWRDEEFFESLTERECFFVHAEFDKTKDTFWDVSFWNSTLGRKKMWRMIYDAIFHPFIHLKASNVFVINTEELATLYHFPGEVAATPGLKRIDSVKGNAPNNLPT